MGIHLTGPDGSTPLDEDEKVGLIPSISTLSDLNEFEAQNIASARQWASRSRIMNNELQSRKALVRLHREMFGKTWRWAGQIRRTGKNLGVDPSQIESQLKQLLDDVSYWIDAKTYSFQEICVRFHHRLVWIHPFPNGNGRHARLMTDLLAEQFGTSPPTWGQSELSKGLDIRERYIVALKAADRHDFQPLLQFAFPENSEPANP